MAELKEDYRKEERINGIVYDMSPSADYRHGIVNSNIHAILKQHLKNSLCLSFMENLDYRYHIPGRSAVTYPLYDRTDCKNF